MKTIFKSALVACIALTTMLVGCAKEQNANEGKDQKTVRLQLSAEMTRAAGQHAEGKVAFNNAAIYFTAGDAIMKMYEIVETGTYPENPEGTTISEEALADGVTFINLQGNINTVYVFANKPDGVYPATGSIAAEFNTATEIALASQTDDEGGVELVSLYGKSTLTPGTNPVTSENDYYTAHVEVAPIVSRFEISQIAATYDDADYQSTITEFTLDGIYLDNYYVSAGFDGVNKGTLVGLGNTDTTYPREGNTEVWDEGNGVTEDDVTYVADSEGELPVWSYNLLAGAIPTIIVKVSDVKVQADVEGNDPLYPGTWYLTVNLTDVEAFEPGKVYNLANLDFAEGHLTHEPYTGAIDIAVTIEVLEWDQVSVGHEF